MKHGTIRKTYYARTDRLLLPVRVAGYECTALIDTGASGSYIPLCTAYECGLLRGTFRVSGNVVRTDTEALGAVDIAARLEILQEKGGESIIEIDRFRMRSCVTGTPCKEELSSDELRSRAAAQARHIEEEDRYILLGLNILRCGSFRLLRKGPALYMTLKL